VANPRRFAALTGKQLQVEEPVSDAQVTTGGRHPASLEWAGLALGFGLGGFFDGILLHQVLQWHHLLSGIESARQDVGFLILTDGLFHVLMYVVTGLGLWLLWRSRRHLQAPGADRRLFADALLGFAAWHIIDAVLSHWLLGIHRIRMDTDNPLLWDLLWLAIFGIVPAVLGWMLRRSGTPRRGKLASSPLALVLAVAVAGPIASLPAPQDSTVMVLFHPDVTPQQAFVAMQAVGGRLLWTDASEQLWAIDVSEAGDTAALYQHGALLVSNSILPAGCLDWTKV
jgi:uncharacterized membrane protein